MNTRKGLDAAEFVSRIVTEFGARPLARKCGVSDHTIRRWASGEDWPTQEAIERLVDALYPMSRAAAPLYRADMAIDGDTRVGGVGEHTIRSARGGRASRRVSDSIYREGHRRSKSRGNH